MIAGAVIGALWPAEAQNLKVVSSIFLRLIKCIVVPLVFSTLIVGIAGHNDDVKSVGRLALKSLIYFEVITTLALAVGLLMVNLIRPGTGVSLNVPVEKSSESIAHPRTTSELLERTVPQSLFESAANNDGLQVVVFAVLFGIALTQVTVKPRETMVNFFEGVSQVMFKFTGLVMKLAPFGIGAAMAVAVGHSGFFHVLRIFGMLVLTLYGAILLFVLAVLLPAARLARIPVLKFLNRIKYPAILAFTTTSSEVALPLAMEELLKMGVSRRVVSFVLPAGYSFNLDGTALYQSVALLFIAQAAGVPMSAGQQSMAMLTLMLTSKGAAGVPRASLVVLSGMLTVFGLPAEGVALLLSVDLIMDMGRTTLNLVGNCLATAVVARWEGELNDK